MCLSLAVLGKDLPVKSRMQRHTVSIVINNIRSHAIFLEANTDYGTPDIFIYASYIGTKQRWCSLWQKRKKRKYSSRCSIMSIVRIVVTNSTCMYCIRV